MIAGPFNFDLIKPVNPLLALFPIGAYGIEHAYRVFKLVDNICDFEKISDDLRQSLKFCALFMDIGREEKQMEQNLGFKSYGKIRGTEFLGKERFQNDLCRFLIESHTLSIEDRSKQLNQYQIEDKDEAIFLFKILQDALALDAFRFGNFCAADLELSNSRKLVLFASQFHRKELKQDLILKEIEDWLKDI
ncbi:HD domain-containing protein [Ancylomarina sp.]|uniref:HD domain-containing protein n=1 Tax=Ancylomarina sp. TaxID=1970196 RepID=UPI0035616FAE